MQMNWLFQCGINASGSVLHGTLGGSPLDKQHSLPASEVWVCGTCFQCCSGDWNSTAGVKIKDVEMPAGHISLVLICPQCCIPTCRATAEIAFDKTHVRGSNYRVSPLNVTHSPHIITFHVSKTHNHKRLMLIIDTYVLYIEILQIELLHIWPKQIKTTHVHIYTQVYRECMMKTVPLEIWSKILRHACLPRSELIMTSCYECLLQTSGASIPSTVKWVVITVWLILPKYANKPRPISFAKTIWFWNEASYCLGNWASPSRSAQRWFFFFFLN